VLVACLLKKDSTAVVVEPSLRIYYRYICFKVAKLYLLAEMRDEKLQSEIEGSPSQITFTKADCSHSATVSNLHTTLNLRFGYDDRYSTIAR
jgi:acid phosphatase family membrane protein YuiD